MSNKYQTHNAQEDDTVIVPVNLGARSYDIKIGPKLLAQADTQLAPFITDRHVIIIADSNTKTLYQSDLADRIAPLCRKVDCLDVPAGEGAKSLAQFSALMEDILVLGVDRQAVLIALGAAA